VELYRDEEWFMWWEKWLMIPLEQRMKEEEDEKMKFKEKDMTGGREMTATIESVHLDKEDENCPVTNKMPKSEQLHFTLKPIEPKWKDQFWWVYNSDAIGSSWYDVIKQFKKLGILNEDDIEEAGTSLALAKTILKNSEGKVFKFEERRLGRAVGQNWFPVGIV
jgi:hypothetical protein